MKSLSLILIFLFTTAAYANSFQAEVRKYLEKDPEYQEIINQTSYENFILKQAQGKLLLPELSLSLSKIKEESLGSDIETEYRSNSLNLSYSLFSFGSDFSNVKAGDYRRKAFSNQLLERLMKAEKTIITLLLNYISQEKTLNIRQEVLNLKEKSLNISQKKFKRGTLSKDDLTKVQIDYSNAKSEFLSAQKRLLKLEDQIAGYDIEKTQLDFPWSEKFQKDGITSLLNQKIKSEDTPQIKKLKMQELRYEYQAKAQKLDYLGNISFNYSRNQRIDDEDEEYYGWRSAIVYTLPLFENFSHKTRVELANANYRTAKTNHLYQKKFWESQLENSKKELKINFEDFKNRIKTLKDSKSLFNSTTKQFKRGKLSVNDLLVEQDRLLKTELLTNNAIYNLHLSYLNLHHIYGKPITLESK